MPAPQPSLSTRARWIIRTQLAAISPRRKHTPGIHTRATGFLPFASPARDVVVRQQARQITTQDRQQAEPAPQPPGGLIHAAAAEAAAHCGYHIGTDHLLLALFRADDQTAAQALTRLGAGESQVRRAVTALQAESGPERSA
jgi:hypothetical protein